MNQTRPAAAIEANRDNRAKCLSRVPLNAKHSLLLLLLLLFVEDVVLHVVVTAELKVLGSGVFCSD